MRDRHGNTSDAVLELKFRRILVQPPLYKQGRYPALELTVLHETERGKPRDREPIDWKLIANLPVTFRTAAIEKLQWYAVRWKIGVSSRRTRLLVGESPTEVKRLRPPSLGRAVAREQDGGALRQHTPKGGCAKHQVVTTSERGCSLATRFIRWPRRSITCEVYALPHLKSY